MHQLLPLTIASLAAAASAQLPCWNPNLGISLGLGDESMSSAQALGFAFAYGGNTYTDIQVCDNGYVTLGATGGVADYDPDPLTLVADPFARICAFWVDLDPGAAGSGDVYFQAVPAAGSDPAYAVITWDGVFEYAGSTPHTFQLVLVDGGAVRCSYGSDLAINTFPWLIGASPGNGALQNPVNFTALPLQTVGNPTLHESDLVGSGSALAGTAIDWLTDGTGGFDVDAVLGCASTDSYGRGCVGAYTSLYEYFVTTPAVDLSNSAFEFALAGASYVVSANSTAFVAPSGAAMNLNLGDDAETTIVLASALPIPGGTTPTLIVGSNGFVATASNNAAADFSPTPTEFLNWGNTAFGVWHDFIPGALGGAVRFEEVNNLSIVTWDAVVGYVGQNPGTTPSTFQLQFDRNTGNVAFVFQSLDTVSVSTWPGGEAWVVGYSPGGMSLDPGNTDLSVALPAGSIVTAPGDSAPLELAASAAPVIGSTIQLTTSNIPPSAAFAGVLLGLAKFDPGIDLTSFGMPGCFQYNDQLSSILLFPAGAGSVALPFTVPNFPGALVTAQAAAYAPAAMLTPLGAIVSGGVELVFGL